LALTILLLPSIGQRSTRKRACLCTSSEILQTHPCHVRSFSLMATEGHTARLQRRVRDMLLQRLRTRCCVCHREWCTHVGTILWVHRRRATDRGLHGARCTYYTPPPPHPHPPHTHSHSTHPPTNPPTHPPTYLDTQISHSRTHSGRQASLAQTQLPPHTHQIHILRRVHCITSHTCRLRTQSSGHQCTEVRHVMSTGLGPTRREWRLSVCLSVCLFAAISHSDASLPLSLTNSLQHV
jgi:hypothetical protein